VLVGVEQEETARKKAEEHLSKQNREQVCTNHIQVDKVIHA
jgi:hypothetical protein